MVLELSLFDKMYLEPRILGLQSAPTVWSPDTTFKAAAVLCLLIPGLERGEALRIVFTRRSTLVRTHRGQIGFPGGRREKEDASPIATALRETQEEIGIDPEWIQILGSLPPVKALDLHPIIPIIGAARLELSDCRCNAAEVAEVFALPWTLFEGGMQQKIRFNVFGRWRETWLYPAAGYHIWGITAAMLSRAELVI